jgi:hypothetical protein
MTDSMNVVRVMSLWMTDYMNVVRVMPLLNDRLYECCKGYVPLNDILQML